MIPKMMLLASLFCLHSGTLEADPTSLNVYRFARGAGYESNLYDLRTTFTFYPDGLTQTVSVTSYTIATRKEKLELRLEVTRLGDVISQHYTTKNSRLSDVTYQLGEDVVSIHYLEMNPPGEATLRSERGANGKDVYFDYLFGRLRYEFTLAPKMNLVETTLRMGRSTYKITFDQAKGVPLVVCEGLTQSNFEFGRIGLEKYSILYKDPGGPLLASYRVEGSLRSLPPLIAVLNFLIYGNLVDGPAVFPFIGGLPSS